MTNAATLDLAALVPATELTGAYACLHLAEETRDLLAARLSGEILGDGIAAECRQHLTLDYYGTITAGTLNASLDTRFAPLPKGRTAGLRAGTPAHFVSDATGENIFYLPVRHAHETDEADFFETLRNRGCSIREPHVTLAKGDRLTHGAIEAALARIRGAINAQLVRFDAKTVHCSAKVAATRQKAIRTLSLRPDGARE